MALRSCRLVVLIDFLQNLHPLHPPHSLSSLSSPPLPFHHQVRALQASLLHLYLHFPCSGLALSNRHTITPRRIAHLLGHQPDNKLSEDKSLSALPNQHL